MDGGAIDQSGHTHTSNLLAVPSSGVESVYVRTANPACPVAIRSTQRQAFLPLRMGPWAVLENHHRGASRMILKRRSPSWREKGQPPF